VIAKAIFEMFNLLPGTSRSTAQTSEQPLQAFSESLLAASKSFLQGNSMSDGSSKSGRRQRSAPDDTKAQTGVIDSGAILSSSDSQQNPKFNAGVTTLQTLLMGSTDADGKSTGFLRQLTQSLPADETTVSESSNALTEIAQTNNVAKNLVLAAGFQSRFATVKIPLTGLTKSQSTRAVAANKPALDAKTTGLTDTQARTAQVNIVPADILRPSAVPSSFATAETPLAQSVMTPTASVDAAIPVTGNVSSTGLAETLSIIAQANTLQPATAQSNIMPVRTPLDGSATAQKASAFVASQPALNMNAAGWNENESSVASTDATNPPSWNVSSAGLAGAKSIATLASIISTSIPQSAVQSKVATVQMPLAVATTAQGTSNAVASQPTRNAMSAGLPETQRIDAQASVLQKNIVGAVNVQSSVTPSSNDLSQSSSPLPVAGVQEMKTPIAASPKSGNDDPSAAASAVQSTPLATDNPTVQNSLAAVAQNAISNAVQNAVANSPIEINPVPVQHAALIASVKDVVASALKTDSNIQTNPQTAADQSSAANTITVPFSIGDQLASVPLYDGSFGTIQTIASSFKPVFSAKQQAGASTSDKGASTGQAEAKKDADAASGTASKAGSQDSPSSGNQSQGGNSSQLQSAAPITVSAPSHSTAAVAPTQSTATVSAAHTSSTPAGAAGVEPKTTDSATTHASTALPQAQPVINTARLIQSMGQSEMRVGMRSNEFGNISISTSTTRDLVSAQISLEHGELAKTLVTHLPEMQARLGGNQPADVRIDMNGAATGQGTGNFGGMSNDSSGQSRGGRQPAGNMAASQSGSSVAEQQLSSVAAAAPSDYARLDIRV